MSEQTEIKLKEQLSSENIGISTIRELWLGEDGQEYQKLIQKVDKKTGRILERCKNPDPQIEIVITVEAVEKPSTPAGNPGEISEEERKAIVEAKFRAKAEKAKRKKEEIRIAAMDDDELAEEQEKTEKQRAMDDLLVARNEAAQDNVSAQRALKAELKTTGATQLEIKNAIRLLKVEQKAQQEEPLEKSKGKKRGRPAKDAVVNPVKDPTTGEFVSSSEKK